MKLLITGGLGFIGSDIIECAYSKGYDIVLVDNMTYAANKENISQKIWQSISIRIDNICDRKAMQEIFEQEQPDIIIHAAAESHVDNSIKFPDIFLKTNILGTQVLLDLAVKYNTRFIYISTDEVYGDFKNGYADIFSPLKPSSPYSVSKAAGDMLTQSYGRTYGLNYSIIRPCNNFGHKQHREKFIPTIVNSILEGKKIPIYGNGLNQREWIPSYICAETILNTIDNKIEIGNLSSEYGLTNLQLTQKVIDILGKGEIEFIEDRKGHDFRYAISCSMKHLIPNFDILKELEITVNLIKEKYENINGG